MIYIFDINPVPKPRMTQSDRWKKRKCTDRYWEFKTALVLIANTKGLKTLPSIIKSMCFYFEMPKTWSGKLKLKMDGSPHQQKPDLDNCLKSVQDCLCKDDSHIHYIGELQKKWSNNGHIEIELY